MELSQIAALPAAAGICLCVGYIIKNLVPGEKINRFIPLIVGVLGVALNLWATGEITPKAIFEGMLAGLSSTGMYEAFSKLFKRA